jgi:hypothetical protein
VARITSELMFKAEKSCSQGQVQFWFYLSGQILFDIINSQHFNILCYVDPLFGNDREISNYTAAVTKQWPLKEQ